jgi:hypothetical protein
MLVSVTVVVVVVVVVVVEEEEELVVVTLSAAANIMCLTYEPPGNMCITPRTGIAQDIHVFIDRRGTAGLRLYAQLTPCIIFTW